MKMITKFILLFSLLLLPIQQEIKEYPLKSGKPTSIGIKEYVEDNKNILVDNFQKYINDTLFLDIYISVDNLSLYSDYDSSELARTEIGKGGNAEIIIDNQGKFNQYSIDAKTKRGTRIYFDEYDQFIRSTIYHELMHLYFRQQELILIEKQTLNNYYQNIQVYPNSEMKFGASFIEEGICEYIIRRNKEIISYKKTYIPKTVADIINKNNTFNVKYEYSSYYIKDFLDLTITQYDNIKTGIDILLTNRPPNYNEILNPKLYFNRLEKLK